LPDISQRALAPAQCRFAVNDAAGTFTGYAAVFNDLVPAFNERVMPGAFTRTIAERSARGDALAILWAHDPREVIGVATSLVEDNYGLRVEGRLILDIDRAREANTLIREGITALSIGFFPVKWTRNDEGEYLIEDAELVEFSVVYAGASPRAKITEIRNIGGPMDPTTTTAPVPAPETRAAPPAIPAPAPDIEARFTEIQTRLDEIEVRAQRVPATVRNPAEQQSEVEMRALTSLIRTGNDAEMRAASTDVGPDLGWTVLPTVDLAIRNVVTEISPLRNLAEVVSISTGSYERFYSLGSDAAEWVTERQTRPQDTPRPQLIKHEYPTAELYAAPQSTRQQLEDSRIDVATWFINDSARKFATAEATAFLRGDGLNGKPKGLLSYGTAATKDFTRAWGTWQHVVSGLAAEMTADNLIDLRDALASAYRPNAKWLMNRTTGSKISKLKDGNGQYLKVPGLTAPDQDTLLGFPVEYDDGIDDVGAGNLPVAFGDFREGYTIVDRSGIRVARDEISVKGQVIFDTYKRIGGGAGNFHALKFLKIAAA